jgi:hypothetical protein
MYEIRIGSVIIICTNSLVYNQLPGGCDLQPENPNSSLHITVIYSFVFKMIY